MQVTGTINTVFGNGDNFYIFILKAADMITQQAGPNRKYESLMRKFSYSQLRELSEIAVWWWVSYYTLKI